MESEALGRRAGPAALPPGGLPSGGPRPPAPQAAKTALDTFVTAGSWSGEISLR